jgi:predicted O-methyltransferase YrrM
LKHTNMKLFCVDPWAQNPQLMEKWDEAYDMYKFLTEEFGDRAVTVRGWSPDIASAFDNKSLDFVYIDAEHTYEAVKADLPAWWAKIKHGGILAGHDYGWETVRKAVDEFVAEYNMRLVARPELKVLVTGVMGNNIASLTGDLDEYDGEQPSWVIIKE